MLMYSAMSCLDGLVPFTVCFQDIAAFLGLTALDTFFRPAGGWRLVVAGAFALNLGTSFESTSSTATILRPSTSKCRCANSSSLHVILYCSLLSSGKPLVSNFGVFVKRMYASCKSSKRLSSTELMTACIFCMPYSTIGRCLRISASNLRSSNLTIED